MGWLDYFKKKKDSGTETDDDSGTETDDDGPVRLCQGCGKKEEGEEKLRTLKQQTSDGLYNFLFCRKCYRKMKKGKLPPLIAQMQSQGRR